MKPRRLPFSSSRRSTTGARPLCGGGNKDRFFKGRRRRQKSDDDDDGTKTVVVFCVVFFFRVFKTQTRDANAPVETETRDAQTLEKTPRAGEKEIFFLFFVFCLLWSLGFPPKKMCNFFVCFLFFETTQERRVFLFLVVGRVCCWSPHTKSLCFVSFLF